MSNVVDWTSTAWSILQGLKIINVLCFGCRILLFMVSQPWRRRSICLRSLVPMWSVCKMNMILLNGKEINMQIQHVAKSHIKLFFGWFGRTIWHLQPIWIIKWIIQNDSVRHSKSEMASNIRVNVNKRFSFSKGLECFPWQTFSFQ